MAIPVCAHINLGPHTNEHYTAQSIDHAVKIFRKRLEQYYGTVDKSIAEIRGTDNMPCVDLYPQCTSLSRRWRCNDAENLHDYPLVRFQVGPRGGIRRVSV